MLIAMIEGLPMVILFVLVAVLALWFSCVWMFTIIRLYIFLGKAEDRHLSILKCLHSISDKLNQAR